MSSSSSASVQGVFRAERRTALYRTIWRWHFYAGLFVMPFVLILSVTGALYLFKPQVDRWEERAFRGLPAAHAVSPNAQLDAALAAFPGARFSSYRLPDRPGDAALIHLMLADGQSMRDVFVSPQGQVIGRFDPDARIEAVISRIHGQLLAGRAGAWLVELAGSWAIVMILTGLFLWWPQGRGMAGVLWPRLSGGGRIVWRDLHAVTGFWVSGLTLVLLVTALPWAAVWGDAFKTVRTELGLVRDRPDWKIGGAAPHAEHDHAAMVRMESAGLALASLERIVEQARGAGLAAPVVIRPPGDAMAWIAESQTQNRPRRESITYDAATGKPIKRTRFSDKHPIDRAIAYGIAWHEGQLFGWVNQAAGLFTAISLVALMVSGFAMWRKRRPGDGLGAPPAAAVPARMPMIVVMLCLLAALLPLLAASLVLLWLVERLILARLPWARTWLGLPA